MFIEIVDFLGETKRFTHKPLEFFLYWRGVYATLFHPVEWDPLVQCIPSSVAKQAPLTSHCSVAQHQKVVFS